MTRYSCYDKVMSFVGMDESCSMFDYDERNTDWNCGNGCCVMMWKG